MIIVAGTMEVDPADRDLFLQGRAEQVKATLREPGCIEYSFAADAFDPGRVRLFEVWESQEALTAHLGALSTTQPSGGGPAVAVKKADVLQYEVSSSGPLKR
jgi:quinol monooxygenase YgiN